MRTVRNVRKRVYLPVAVLITMLSVSAIQPGDTLGWSLFAKQTLERRIVELTQRKLDECKTNALSAAEILIDSLLIREAMEKRRLEEGLPVRPTRPEDPDPDLIKGDSLQVRPLF